MARIGGEDIEGLTLKPYEAVTAIGAGKFKAFSRTVIIELLPGYLSNSLYVLEANIRHAAILGYVGAGGIGLLLNEKISWREYSRVGMILVMLSGMYSQSGCVIPCIIAPTTLIPSFDVDTSLTALRLYTKNTMIHTLIITFAVVFLLIRPSRYAFCRSACG